MIVKYYRTIMSIRSLALTKSHQKKVFFNVFFSLKTCTIGWFLVFLSCILIILISVHSNKLETCVQLPFAVRNWSRHLSSLFFHWCHGWSFNHQRKKKFSSTSPLWQVMVLCCTWWRISIVVSVLPSSQITISLTGTVCARMERNCSSMYRAPL